MNTKMERRLALFRELPVVQNFPEMEEIFQRASQKNPYGWDLPVLGGKVIQGDAVDALATEVALGCLQISIILIDDMLDEEPDGLFRQMGSAQVANLAAAFQAAGLAVIANLAGAVSEARVLRGVALLNEMLLMTAYGQKMDVENLASEEQYWQVVEYKSVPYYQAGIVLGSVLAGATPEEAQTVSAFGRLYGELIQLHDDLKDTMSAELNPDWLQRRYPLPILFAELVQHPQQERFLSLRAEIEAPGALEEAQQILVASGAVSYCLDQIVARYRQGKVLLGENNLPEPAPFHMLLDDLIDPVRDVFNRLDISQEEQAAILAGG